MSAKFADSFDHYVTANIAQKWTSLFQASISNSGRNGSCAQITSGGFLSKTLSYADTWITGWAFRVNSSKDTGFGSIYALQTIPLPGQAGPITLASLFIENDGTLTGAAGTSGLIGNSSIALSINKWYYIEVKTIVSGSTNVAVAMTVKLNGQTVISGSALSGVDANNTVIKAIAGTIKANMHNYGAAGALGSTSIDDLYIVDGLGTKNKDFIGDVAIGCVFPRKDEGSAWTPLTGPDHYKMVNEHAPDDDTSYIHTNGIGNIDDFDFDPISSFLGTIPFVHFLLYARKDDEGTRSIKHTVNGAAPGAEEFLGDNYIYYHIPLDDNSGSDWTVGGFNGSKFGVQLIS